MNTSTITTKDNTKLSITIKDQSSSEWIIVTHGVGEHSGRHSYWLRDGFTDRNVLLWDHRGHGKSEGERGYAKDFDIYLSDLDDMIAYLAKNHNMKKFNLFGHSMGGLITARWVQKRKDAVLYPEKTILSAPATGGGGILGTILENIPGAVYSGLVSLPSLALSGMLPLNKLSHDPKVEKDYVSDPLNVLKVHSHLYFEILQKAKDTFSKPLQSRKPLMCIVGNEDVIINKDITVKFFTEIDKNGKLVVIPGAYHEMYMEVPEYNLPFEKNIQEFLGKAK